MGGVGLGNWGSVSVRFGDPRMYVAWAKLERVSRLGVLDGEFDTERAVNYVRYYSCR